MNKIAQFEKISNEQCVKDFPPMFDTYYDETPIIKLPTRSTSGSAGYDFYAPFDIEIPFGQSMVVPTGVRCKIEDGWFLALFPRSGQGFKAGIEIMNTVGIIDADYYFADNEGHIMVKLTNKDISVNKPFKVEQGKAFCQGIFLPYGVTTDDEETSKELRTGGFGSTDKK